MDLDQTLKSLSDNLCSTTQLAESLGDIAILTFIPFAQLK